MDLPRKKILVIEDDISYLNSLVDKLTVGGYEVIKAGDGEEGLRLAQERHPDLMVIDIKLPKLSGMVVMNKLRHDIWGETLPIILLTNLEPDDNMIAQITQDQPSYYLIKANTSLDEVLDKVNEVLAIPPK